MRGGQVEVESFFDFYHQTLNFVFFVLGLVGEMDNLPGVCDLHVDDRACFESTFFTKSFKESTKSKIKKFQKIFINFQFFRIFELFAKVQILEIL